ncbi:MAG: PAS domain-containing protein [Muribaculaceae bacterium]|nr:PAS domain-containing protein [Muribaculaceae bacterium]
MGIRFIFTLTFLAFTALFLSSIHRPEHGLWTVIVFGIIGIISLILLYYRLVRSNHAVQIGMELLSAQDFNSRLRKVGERNADKVVKLFNTMIDQLREERLKNVEQESLLMLLLEASPMGVAIMDYDGRLAMCNNTFLKINGVSDDSRLKGMAPDEWPIELSENLAHLKLGKSEVVSLGTTKRYRCYHLNFMRHGFPRHFYLVESLTQEMREAERSAYEKVIRILSHEVNNTMCGVRSIFGLLSETIHDKDLEEAIGSCDRRCELLCEFVTSYADVIRLPQPNIKEIDLVNEINRMLPFLRMMLPEDVELLTEFPQKKVIISADNIQLQQVMINVVKNAMESIKGEGYVLIRISEEKRSYVLEIVNNGEPIPEEVAKNMFRPFFTNKPNGRGIGLTLTSEILTRHKTNFRLFTGKDGLTRFKISFHL